MKILFPIIFCTAILFFSCKNKTENTSDGETLVADPADGTVQMVAELKKISDNPDPQKMWHMNRKMAEFLEQQYSTIPPNQLNSINAIQLKSKICFEWFKAGELMKAEPMLREVLEKLQASPDAPGLKESIISIKEVMVALYIRLGEQDNCLLNHNSFSCIMPLADEAYHQEQRGSKLALIYLDELLKSDPQNMKYRWLLNLAYQTLGEYPHSVPSQLLIPESVFKSDYDIKRFPDIAMNLGVAVNKISGGCCVEDFDNDGFLDIIATSYGLSDQMQYFHNNGNGTFSDLTNSSGLLGLTSGLNIIHADTDNDGDEDVFVLRGAWLGEAGKHPNSLLRNNGNNTFTDITRSAGIYSLHPTQAGVFADFNNDGWIDLFIGNESKAATDVNPCELFINSGDGHFSDKALVSRVDLSAWVKGVTASDYDHDGWVDLYVSVVDDKNHLFKNSGTDENGNIKFTDVTDAAGVAEPIESFPCWFFDFDNDGWEDLFVSGFASDEFPQSAGEVAADYLGKDEGGPRSKLFRNNQNGTFTDITQVMNLDAVVFAMGANFGDLDNDGWLDIYIGTGTPDYTSLYPNRMFRNNSAKVFQDVTTSGGFGNIQKGHGIAFGDLDNDGDQDIYVVLGGSYEGDNYFNQFLLNPGHENNWISLELEGVKSNRAAIGTVIKVNVTENNFERNIYCTVGTGGSFGASTMQAEIGLGKATAINYIEINWAGSHLIQKIESIEMNKAYHVKEGESPDQLPYKLIEFKIGDGEMDHLEM